MSDALMKNANVAECSASTQTTTNDCLSAPVAGVDASPSTRGCRSAIRDPWAAFVAGISGQATCPAPYIDEEVKPVGIERTAPSAPPATSIFSTLITRPKKSKAADKLEHRLAKAKAKLIRAGWRKAGIENRKQSLLAEERLVVIERTALLRDIALLEELIRDES